MLKVSRHAKVSGYSVVLAVFLFMRKMIQFSDVSVLTKDIDDKADGKDNQAISNFRIPAEVEVFEITGPLFFGAAYKFKDAIKFIEKRPKVLIIRMRQVPIIDATGIKTIEEVYKRYYNNPDVQNILSKAKTQ